MEKIEVFQNCTVYVNTVYGNVIKLPDVQLDRQVYMEVKKAFEGIGGKWVGGKVYGFKFNADPTELLEKLAGGDKINLKKDYQFFETPSDIADYVVEMAGLKEEHMILEPSAGHGAMLKAINKIFPGKEVDCYELSPDNRKVLLKETVLFKAAVLGNDFMTSDLSMRYDRIVANPPFTKNQDIVHIQRMYKHLKHGGRLVSIASKHWEISNNSVETEFRNFLCEVKAEISPLPKGSFKESGTEIATNIIVINKK